MRYVFSGADNWCENLHLCPAETIGQSCCKLVVLRYPSPELQLFLGIRLVFAVARGKAWFNPDCCGFAMTLAVSLSCRERWLYHSIKFVVLDFAVASFSCFAMTLAAIPTEVSGQS
jgi:hypothetical protein